jgi:alpha-glucosidase
VKFLKRLRGLLDEYDARMSLGEIGDAGNALQIVADYTSGGDKLNMCYTFDLLSPQFSAGHVRKCISDFEKVVADGWVCWAFSNHDVVRHVTRWTPPDGDKDRVARFSLALLISLRGSICIYQGEELGLLEAELEFEDLRDPYGIRFWPGFKGRDGARTPMPWDRDKPNGGFSTGKPWLPVPAGHQANAVSRQEVDKASVLAAYREALRLRKRSPALVKGDIELLGEKGDEVLAFIRSTPGERVFCAFNFSGEEIELPLPASDRKFEVLSAVMKGSPAGKSSIALPPLGWIVAVIA